MNKNNLLEIIKVNFENLFKSKFWKDKFNISFVLTNVLVNIFIWLFLVLRLKPSNYPVPLHFNIYFGIDVVDDWSQAFLIPTIGIIVIVINLILAYFIYSREKFITQFLLVSSLFIQIVLFLASIGVVIIR